MACKRILVVGATSSLAQAICRELAARGRELILCGRDEEELSLLAADIAARYQTPCGMLLADLMSPEFSPVALIDAAGEFDGAILAVGDMGSGTSDLADIAYTMHINYTLPAEIACVAAEYLSEKGGGTMALISSVAGDRGRQSNYHYGSAKAALTAFASGLRNRYFKRGVHVLTVKPGFTDTPMTWGMHSPLIASREYVAKKIVEAMEKKKNVVYVPFFWRYIMLIICHIPEFLFKRLSL